MKSAWGIIRSALLEAIDADRVPKLTSEAFHAKLDQIARDADDAIEALRAARSPSEESPVK